MSPREISVAICTLHTGHNSLVLSIANLKITGDLGSWSKAEPFESVL